MLTAKDYLFGQVCETRGPSSLSVHPGGFAAANCFSAQFGLGSSIVVYYSVASEKLSESWIQTR